MPSPGRPPASYLVPRVWGTVSTLGYAPSHRALIELRRSVKSPLPMKSELTNRHFETKYTNGTLKLVDYKSAQDVFSMLNVALAERSLPLLVARDEVVQFAFRINGLSDASQRFPGGMMGVATAAGVMEETVEACASGRLVPQALAIRLAGIVGLGANAVVQLSPGPKQAPISEPVLVQDISNSL